MNKQYVEIAPDTYCALERIAQENGLESVEDLLTIFAENFSTGCSVTLPLKLKVA